MTMQTEAGSAGSKDWVALAGRILIAAIFVQAGFSKITGFAGTAGWIASAGLPMPSVATAVAIVVELLGGLMLIAGYRTRIAALTIAAFTVAASLLFHGYWSLPADKQMTDYLMFWKNLSIVGGLLMVWAFGPGRLSLDRG